MSVIIISLKYRNWFYMMRTEKGGQDIEKVTPP